MPGFSVEPASGPLWLLISALVRLRGQTAPTQVEDFTFGLGFQQRRQELEILQDLECGEREDSAEQMEETLVMPLTNIWEGMSQSLRWTLKRSTTDLTLNRSC